MDKIVVIGACGRVGLPFCLVAAEAGFEVIGIDKNKALVEKILFTCKMPYVEEGAQPLLDKHLDNNITLYSDIKGVMLDDVKFVVIMIGTPIDEYNNPRLDAIYDVFDTMPFDKLPKDVIFILRSTVAPGTTESINEKINSYRIVFAPERVAQGKSIIETTSIPQIVGYDYIYDDTIPQKVHEFFVKLGTKKIIELTAREAEIAKLVTNMYRYINFAFANEVYMIASDQGADPHAIIQAANEDYPRMNMPMPGPNVGGPCLYKDGQFLVSDESYIDMIQSAFRINESMPAYVYNAMLSVRPNDRKPYEKVLILGVTFKAENDDTRNSLAYKFMKILKRNNIEYDFIDPYLDKDKWDSFKEDSLKDFDAVVIFTPHKQCAEKVQQWIDSKSRPLDYKVIADPWKIVEISNDVPSGIYRLSFHNDVWWAEESTY
jgi:UDP-N-acetyl-D-mannosaminuronic acid dehydrogenase